MWLWLLVALAMAGDKVAPAELPAAVTATLTSRWPDAVPERAVRRDGAFDVRLSRGDHDLRALVREDGTVVQTFEDIDPGALPAEVARVAIGYGPILDAARHDLADGSTDYRVVVRWDGERQVLRISPQGVLAREPRRNDIPFRDHDWDADPGMDMGAIDIEDADEGSER